MNNERQVFPHSADYHNRKYSLADTSNTEIKQESWIIPAFFPVVVLNSVSIVANINVYYIWKVHILK